jgi:hypothetical protein
VGKSARSQSKCWGVCSTIRVSVCQKRRGVPVSLGNCLSRGNSGREESYFRDKSGNLAWHVAGKSAHLALNSAAVQQRFAVQSTFSRVSWRDVRKFVVDYISHGNILDILKHDPPRLCAR